METCLIVFTRYPEAGKAKTRLIPALGAEGAAQLHRRMTEGAISQAQHIDTEVIVHFTGAASEQMQAWLGEDLKYRSQGSGDLGDRMLHAFETAFEQGYRAVVIIGTDCPALDADLLAIAFEKLTENDLVLGPTTDGGYYLIGLRRAIPELFRGIAWSTEVVLEQTSAIAKKLHLKTVQLPMLNDIDRPEDLR